MLYDGIQLLEGSDVTNLTVDSGPSFPSNPTTGELFYNTTVGALHVYSGSAWVSAGSGGGGTPGGFNTQVQFNNAGAFAGSPRLEWDNATATLLLGADDIGGINAVIRTSSKALTSNASGRELLVQGGTAGFGGINGALRLWGGSGGGGNSLGGLVEVAGGEGEGVNGAGGSVSIRGGTGAAGNGIIAFTTSAVERLRILANGAWSVGPGGGDTGTSGQVLTTAGNGGPPTWAATPAPTSVTGTTGTTGGAASVTGGFGNAGNGGAVTITGGFTTGPTGTVGGSVTIAGGAAFSGDVHGGNVSIIGGAGATGVLRNSGSVTVQGGPGGNGRGAGTVLLAGGDGPVAPGGNVTVRGGNSSSTSGGGNLLLQGGTSAVAASGGYIALSTASALTLAERFRILNNGAWSVGSAGTNTGTSGQVLTSTGSTTPPTWQATGTTVPALTATRIAFGSAGNLLTSSTDFTYETASRTLSVGNSTSGVINNGSDGGDLRLTTVGGVSTAGAIVINPGSSTSTSPANVTISAGSSTASSGSGGHLFLNGGTGSGTGASASGGSAFVRGGSSTNGTGANAGGDATLEGGAANQSGGTSGDAIIMGGTGAAGSIGGIISLWTGPSNTEVERLRIANNGAWGLAGANYGTSGQVLTSTGSTTAPTWQAATVTSVTEAQVTDGALLARNAGNETITGTWSFSSNVTVPLAPTASGHAASKEYVDNAITGLSWKQSVRAATSPLDVNSGNLAALSGLQTVDGVTLIAGDRVLVKNQTTQSQNGIYTVVDPGAWTRTDDFNIAAEVNGAAVFIREGTLQQRTAWTQTSIVVTVGSDPMTFVVFSATGGAVAKSGDTMSGDLIINADLDLNGGNITVTNTTDGLAGLQIENLSTGTSAQSMVIAANDTGRWVAIGATGSLFAPAGEANMGWVGTGTGTPLGFTTNDTERLRIDAAGLVLINTTAQVDGAQLTVSGTVSVATPTAASHATTKAYVDSGVAGATNGLTMSIVTGTTQAAVAGNFYVLTNTTAATTITLPASATIGDTIAFANFTTRTDGIADRNGHNINAAAANLAIDALAGTVTLRYANTAIGWIAY